MCNRNSTPIIGGLEDGRSTFNLKILITPNVLFMKHILILICVIVHKTRKFYLSKGFLGFKLLFLQTLGTHVSRGTLLWKK
jgi:hypothetical protein